MKILEQIKEMFSIDLRLLGIFRILLGIIMTLDLLDRLRFLKLFYTDQGAVPRNFMIDHHWAPWKFSIHMASGSYEWQLVLFIITIVFSLMFTVGYKTKLSTVALYILTISLQIRNHFVLDAGDVVVKMLLFTAIFLPLEVKYALTPYEKTPPQIDNRICSIATVAFIIQVISIYLFSALLKTGETWSNGTALYYVMNIDYFTNSLANTLLKAPLVMKILTYYTFYLEAFGWILLFIPFFWKQFRTIGVLLFILLHIGIDLFMDIGYFPSICIVMWIVLLPSGIADKIDTLLKPLKNRIASYVQNIRSRISLTTKTYRKISPLSSCIILIVSIATLFWNLNSVNKNLNIELFKTVVRYTATWQRWGMFAENPYKYNGWVVIDGHLSNDEHINLIDGSQPLTYEKPYDLNNYYNNNRFIKFSENIVKKKNKKLRAKWGSCLCKQWKKREDSVQLETLSILYFKQKTPPYGQPKDTIEKITLWNHWCDERFKNRFDEE